MAAKFTNEEIAAKIDYEGMPDALEWFREDEFEDQELAQLWYDAQQQYGVLNGMIKRIEDHLDGEMP